MKKRKLACPCCLKPLKMDRLKNGVRRQSCLSKDHSYCMVSTPMGFNDLFREKQPKAGKGVR